MPKQRYRAEKQEIRAIAEKEEKHVSWKEKKWAIAEQKRKEANARNIKQGVEQLQETKTTET